MTSPKNNSLLAIICGHERGGTTLVSEILKQHSDIEGGFEGGILLGRKPKDFLSIEPYYTNFKRGWGLVDNDLMYICSSDNWYDVYNRLHERYNINNKNIKLNYRLIDKTPKYMSVLNRVLNNIPDTPCICVLRDPRAVIYSWMKHEKLNVNDDKLRLWVIKLSKRYRAYVKGLVEANAQHGSRILLIKYENIVFNSEQEFKKIFNYLELEFDKKYLDFSSIWPNVYGRHVSPDYVHEFKHNLTNDVCELILRHTEDVYAWWKK